MIQFLKFQVSLFEKIEKRGISALFSSFLILGIIPFSILFILFYDELYLLKNVSLYLVFTWFIFARYLAYLGFKTSQESFDNFKELFQSQKIFEDKNNRLCKDFYSNKSVFMSLPFMICGIYVINNYFYQASLGLHIWLTLFVVVLLLFAGLGLWNAFNSLRYITDILKDGLNINPLHPDGFGGLEPIGDFIIKITLIISSGSLILPFSIMAVSNGIIGEEFRFITFILAGSYIFLVLFSFIIPLLKLSKIAKKEKYNIVKKSIRKYDEMLKELLDHPSTENQVKVETYHATYLSEIKQMKIWPFTGLTLIQVSGAIALPATTLLLQILDIL